MTYFPLWIPKLIEETDDGESRGWAFNAQASDLMSTIKSEYNKIVKKVVNSQERRGEEAETDQAFAAWEKKVQAALASAWRTQDVIRIADVQGALFYGFPPSALRKGFRANEVSFFSGLVRRGVVES